jgi:hypothetical protein
MLDRNDSDLYVRGEGGEQGIKPQHVIALLAIVAVLYVAGSAVLSLVR